MKSFFATAALATSAFAMNESVMPTMQTKTSSGTDLMTIAVTSSWMKSDAAAADSTVDIHVTGVFTRSADFTNPDVWLSNYKWNFIFSENAESASSEAHLFTTTTTNVQTQAYGTTTSNADSWDGAIATPAAGGSWLYKLNADADITTQPSSGTTPPGADYWKVGVDSRVTDGVWTLKMSRSAAGVSGIKVGATENKTIAAMSFLAKSSNSKLWTNKMDFTIAAEPAVNETNDGATSVTTFGAAVVAAIAALMF